MNIAMYPNTKAKSECHYARLVWEYCGGQHTETLRLSMYVHE